MGFITRRSAQRLLLKAAPLGRTSANSSHEAECRHSPHRALLPATRKLAHIFPGYDVCLTVWDDVDPNHVKESGGKIE